MLPQSIEGTAGAAWLPARTQGLNGLQPVQNEQRASSQSSAAPGASSTHPPSALNGPTPHVLTTINNNPYGQANGANGGQMRPIFSLNQQFSQAQATNSNASLALNVNNGATWRPILAAEAIMPAIEMSAVSPLTEAPRSLETLPAEVRIKIYRHIFRGVELEVSRQTMQYCNTNDDLSPYRVINHPATEVLRTSRLLCNEALPLLNAATVLDVKDTFGRTDPLARIPNAFLARITSIKVEMDAFTHINRKRLPALKHVHLVNEVDAPGGFSDVVHVMNCQRCGGVGAVIDESMRDIFSWKWKQQQFAHLGREEGFTVTMTVLWSFYAAVEAGIVRTPSLGPHTVY